MPLLERFWKPFIERVRHTEATVSRDEVAQARDLGIDPASGKPMSVRMGRFGPFVQIGTKDDPDKPRFAGLRPGQKMDTITHGEALELFKLPRALGSTPSGEPIVANIGRFGPYLKYGAKYVSLKVDDPYTVTPERALEVIREKEIADANRLILDFPDAGIQVLNGRYGPYITDKARNAKIPKDRDPKTLTLDECQALLAAAPARGFGKWGRKAGGAKTAGAKTASAKPANAKPADAKPAGAKPAAARARAATADSIGAAVKSASTARGTRSAVVPRGKTPTKAAARRAAAGKTGTAKRKATPRARSASGRTP